MEIDSWAAVNLHLDPRWPDLGPDRDNPDRTFLRVHCPQWQPHREDRA
jgi:hypothetical protein